MVLKEWIIIPNHVHGIIYIVDPPNSADVETPKLGVSTGGRKANWKSGNLGVMINQYKRACTINIRKKIPEFSWQSRFYDRIIRNHDELNRIEYYIKNNPINWLKDDLHDNNKVNINSK